VKNKNIKQKYKTDRKKKTKKSNQKKIIKKHNRHQHNTDDGGQAMGEELRHVYGAPLVKILYLTDLAQKLLSLRI